MSLQEHGAVKLMDRMIMRKKEGRKEREGEREALFVLGVSSLPARYVSSP